MMMTLRLTSHLNGFHFLNPQSSTTLSLSISHRTQYQSLVVCARKRKKRVGYGGIARFVLKSLSLLSPSLQILPQPLDLVIADGGGSGGRGFWRGWGRFDGWRRKRNRVPILIFICVILWICGFCKISGKEIKSDKVFKVLGLCLFGLAIVKDLKREARYFFFGFLCFIASMVLGFKKDNLVKLTSGIRSSSSILFCKQKRRTRV